ncbi:hypothetical protein [Ramlibacter sp. AN1133]|uniref:hypothetical protein n=1 Tax=Ramlibacter sp. AN1133 TaxID=3133429 RepID=UPI0030BEA704
MTRFFSAKPLLAAAIAIGALAAGSAAHARTDVFLSIGVPGVYVQPAPVYVQPQPVYVQPEPVYVQPDRVYVQPRPVYVQPQPVYIEEHRRGHGRHRHGPWGDADRDGVPNRFDHAPFNPYRR